MIRNNFLGEGLQGLKNKLFRRSNKQNLEGSQCCPEGWAAEPPGDEAFHCIFYLMWLKDMQNNIIGIILVVLIYALKMSGSGHREPGDLVSQSINRPIGKRSLSECYRGSWATNLPRGVIFNLF